MSLVKNAKRVIGAAGVLALINFARTFKDRKRKFSKLGRFRKVKPSFSNLGGGVELVKVKRKRKKISSK